MVYAFINNFYTTNSYPQFYAMSNTVWQVRPLVSGASLTHSSPSSTPFTTAGFTTNYPEVSFSKPKSSYVTLSSASAVYAFHLIAGQISPNLPHLIMLVKGEYDTGYYIGANRYFIGWVTFSKYAISPGVYIKSIDPNMIFKIGVRAIGVLINAADITNDPELEDFDLGIAVEITPWNSFFEILGV
jgi:hypothetical protein